MTSKSQRMEELENYLKDALEQINLIKDEVTRLREEKTGLFEQLVAVREELDSQSAQIKNLELRCGVNITRDDSNEEGRHQSGDGKNSSGTEITKDAEARVTTQADILAEAIRISTLPCPTLETNDKPSIKKFIQKMEEYRMLGGKKKMSSLIKARIIETLIDKFNIDTEMFLGFSDEEVKDMIIGQFHSKNGFAWNEEIKKVKLKKSKDYSYGLMRDYIEDFKFSMMFAGEEHAPHMKSVIKAFLRGLDDEKLSLEIERQNPMTLEMAFKYAEQVRSTLSDYHSLSRAFEHNIQDGLKKSGNSNHDSFQKKGTIPVSNSLQNKEKKWCSYHKNSTHNTEDCYSLKNMPKEQNQTETNRQTSTLTQPKTQSKSKLTPTWERKTSAKRIEVNSVNSLYELNPNLHYEIVGITDDLDYDWQNAFQIRALLDSGSSDNLVNETVYRRLKERKHLTETFVNVSVKYAKESSDENRQLPLVTAQLKLNLQGVELSVKTQFLVINDLNEECILGLPVLREYGLLSYIENPISWLRIHVPISTEEQNESELLTSDFDGTTITNSLSESIDETKLDIANEFSLKSELIGIINTYEYQFRPLTSEDCLKVPPMQINLREGAKLNSRSPRRVSDSVRKLIRDECQRLLDLGFISTSFSEVTCPVVPVIQKGKFRL